MATAPAIQGIVKLMSTSNHKNWSTVYAVLLGRRLLICNNAKSFTSDNGVSLAYTIDFSPTNASSPHISEVVHISPSEGVRIKDNAFEQPPVKPRSFDNKLMYCLALFNVYDKTRVLRSIYLRMENLASLESWKAALDEGSAYTKSCTSRSSFTLYH